MIEYKLDKSAFSVANVGDEPDEKAYWASKTPLERLAAAEFLRQQLYGYDPTTTRLRRVFEVVELEWR